MWSTKSLDVLLADSLCAQCGRGAGGRAGYKSNIYSNRNIMNISCWDAVEAGPDRHLHPWCAAATLVRLQLTQTEPDKLPIGHHMAISCWIWDEWGYSNKVFFTPNLGICRIANEWVGRESLQIWTGRRRICWYISAHRTDWPINQSRKLAVSNSQVQNNWGQVFASCNEFLKHTYYWMLKI